MAEKNNTLLLVALGVGGYLWWKSTQQPAPGTGLPAPLANNAMPDQPALPVYINTATPDNSATSNLALGAGGAAPPQIPHVTTQPLPVTTPVTVTSVPAAGNVVIMAPASIPLASPVMPFGLPAGMGGAKPLTYGGQITTQLPNGQLLAPQVDDTLMMEFQNGNYPGANHPAMMSGVYC